MPPNKIYTRCLCLSFGSCCGSSLLRKGYCCLQALIFPRNFQKNFREKMRWVCHEKYFFLRGCEAIRVMLVANCNASRYWLLVLPVVANGSSCCFFTSRLHIPHAFVATWKVWKVSCGEFRDCLTRCTNLQLSQVVAKCEQILYVISCEFDERAREAKICCQSRPAL